MKKRKSHIFQSVLVILLLITVSSCTKTEHKVFTNNDPQSPHRVPTIRVESYVNRLFIDLVGRSALEEELAVETQKLIDAKLGLAARKELIIRLQTDTIPIVGDSSYNIAYHQRLYDIMKSRLCEGADDEEFLKAVGIARFAIKVARAEGDSVRVFEALELITRNLNVVDGKVQLRKGEITINQLFARMMNNTVYDNINMNSFNFVNASFDNLFFRFPTRNEFNIAFDIIEKNKVGSLFGGFASNKSEYCTLLTESNEFWEGLIQWTYITLLAREASTQEVVNHFNKLIKDKNFKALQLDILVTDEYADF